MTSGFVVVDKPSGLTSHDVVGRVRRRFRLKGRVGHAGTLDPMATGVLIVAVDRATRLLPYLLADEKEYVAEVALGEETDTLDREGKIIGTRAVPSDWRAHLEQAMRAERDRREQVPPRVSAIHVDGERAHDRARRGESFDLAPRAVRLLDLELLSEAPLRFRMRVEKGYYVRAFARDLAESLGTFGHLTALRRTRSGIFSESEAISLQDFAGELISVESMARRLFPALTLAEDDIKALLQGKRPIVSPLAEDPDVRTANRVALFSESGRLVGVQRATFSEAGLALGDDAVRFPEEPADEGPEKA